MSEILLLMLLSKLWPHMVWEEKNLESPESEKEQL